jgi:hypothetical protein
MTKIVSIRMPEVLARAVRDDAEERQMSVSAFVAWILDIALQAALDLSALPDAQERLDGKIDCRLPAEILSRLRPVCRQFRVPSSVYIRTLMYAGHTQRLTLVQAGCGYTLVANHDQK